MPTWPKTVLAGDDALLRDGTTACSRRAVAARPPLALLAQEEADLLLVDVRAAGHQRPRAAAASSARTTRCPRS